MNDNQGDPSNPQANAEEGEAQREPPQAAEERGDQDELVEDQHHSLQEIRREQMMKQAHFTGQQVQGHGGPAVFTNHFSAPYVMPSTEYTTVCNTDFAPLICNEFVSSFLQQDGQGMGLANNEGKLERREAIDLTRHLCHWLSKEAMTCAVVELNS